MLRKKFRWWGVSFIVWVLIFPVTAGIGWIFMIAAPIACAVGLLNLGAYFGGDELHLVQLAGPGSLHPVPGLLVAAVTGWLLFAVGHSLWQTTKNIQVWLMGQKPM